MQQTFMDLSDLLTAEDRDAFENTTHNVLLRCYASVISESPYFKPILKLLDAMAEEEIDQHTIRAYWRHRLVGMPHEVAIKQLEKICRAEGDSRGGYAEWDLCLDVRRLQIIS